MQRLNTKERKAKNFIEMAFEPHKGTWMETSKELIDAYNGKYFSRAENKDRFVVNTIYSLVNLILPNFIINTPLIRVKPQQSVYWVKDILGEPQARDNIEAAKTREIALNYQYNKINAILEARKAVQDSLFYGIGICKTGYGYRTTSTPDKDYVVEDSVFHKRVNPKDFGWHPLATGVDDSPMLVHRVVTTKEQLKNMEGLKNIEDIQPELPDHLKKKVEKKKLQELMDYVTCYEVSDQENDMIYYYGGETKIFLGKKKRIYKVQGSDYNMIKFGGDIDEFLGIPMLQMIKSEAEALNEAMTMIIEHFRKFPGQIFIEQGTVDDDELEAIRTGRQGSIHLVSNLSDGKLQFKPPLNMGQEYFGIVNLLVQTIDRILGIPDFQRSSTRRSATEASYIQGDTEIRRKYFAGIVKDFVLDGVKKIAAIQAQFQTKEEKLWLMDETGSHEVIITPENLKGEWKLDFDIDTMAYVNQAELNNLVNGLNVIGGQPALQPILGTLDPAKLGKEVFKRMNMNIEAFQRTEPENMAHVPPERENKLAREEKPMPNPKTGEDHEKHIEIHKAELERGWNDQIAQHIVNTQVLMYQEMGKQAESMTPMGQGGMMQGQQGAGDIGEMAQALAGTGPNEQLPGRPPMEPQTSPIGVPG